MPNQVQSLATQGVKLRHHSYCVGDVLQGFGLTNAGRFYTVKALGTTAGRMMLEQHLTGKTFWTFDNGPYRLAD